MTQTETAAEKTTNLRNSHGFTVLKVGRWDSCGFTDFVTIDGEIDHYLQVSAQDVKEGFANFPLWLLEVAYRNIYATEDNPQNDTRAKRRNGDGWAVKQAIEKAIETYKANMDLEEEA